MRARALFACVCLPQVPPSVQQPAGEPVADPVRRPHEPRVCRDLSLLARTRSHTFTHMSALARTDTRATTHARKCRGSILDVPVCFPQTPLSVRQVLVVTVCFPQAPDSGQQPAGDPVADPVLRPHEPPVCRDLSLFARTRSYAHATAHAAPCSAALSQSLALLSCPPFCVPLSHAQTRVSV